MQDTYKLVGLNKLHNDECISASIETFGLQETFHASLCMNNDNKLGLFKYLKNHWSEYSPTCEVIYEGDYKSPKNCLVLIVNLKQL